MVVPIERVGRGDKLKKFVGNNLSLNMANNKNTLAVTGNNCKIKIEENSGVIRVVGDRCDVTVLKGCANIDYVGNSGRIHLGVDVSDDTVTYVGNQGEISTVVEGKTGSEAKNCSGEEKTKPRPTKATSNKSQTINITNSNRIRMANPCFPNNINISFPVIRIGRVEQRLARNN